MAKHPKNGKLNDQQERFCQEYLKDLNATKAAVRAGYAKAGAHVEGCRLLKNPKVDARVQELMKERGARTAVTADRVIQEIERLAMFDPAELVYVKSPMDIAELPEEVRRAIVGWSWSKDGDFIVKLAKEKALEMLGRHHKLFTDKIEHSGKVTLEDLVATPTKESSE